MASGFWTDSITRGRRGPDALLDSASRTTLAALSFGLALGVALPREACAGAGTVNPVQTSTYSLGTHNPTTFGAGTSINAVSPSDAGVYGGSGASWNVTNYGGIRGPSGGVELNSSGSAVTNWGTIGGNGGVGVHFPNGGAVTNESSGSISGYAGVIIGRGTGTVTNAGSINGQALAVFVSSGSVDNETGGAISMTSSGSPSLTVYVGNGGSVTNAGTITNSGTNTSAVVIGGGGGGVVTNSGTISATGALDAAVYTLNGGTVTNSGTLVVTAANSAGVYFLNGGTLHNSGAINATGTGDLGVWMPKGGLVTNTGTITDTATGGIGVGAQLGGTVTNQKGGKISGASAGVFVASGVGSVTNAGQILASAPTGYAVALRGGGTVTNTGKINGSVLGVAISGGSPASNSVMNSGGIYATATNGAGVSLNSGGTVTNQAGGTISGAAHGVFLTGGTSLLNNAGEIYGSAASGNGAVLGSGGSVTNTGKISSGNLGVYIVGGAGAVTNSGAVTGTNRGGVALLGGGIVTNQIGGTISGANFGIAISGGSAASNSVTNAGWISAAAMNSIGVNFGSGGAVTNRTGAMISGGSLGVYLRGSSGSVTNAGSIAGGSASVAFEGSGTNTLTLQTGSVLNGAAFGSAASGATNALILSGQGTANNNFINFNTLSAKGTGEWTLSGYLGLSGEANVSAGTLQVTGSFKSATLEIAAGAEFDDAGSVAVTGAVTNAGNLTINGVTMIVAGDGGTFTQQAGGSTTLLSGGKLDPAQIVIKGGVFGGSSTVVGDVAVTGGKLQVGATPGGSLTVEGDYSQTAGEIVFEVDPNGHGGFLETTLVFDPSFGIAISDTSIVFDFLDGADAHQFIADNLLNLNTFFALTGGGQFCGELNCANVFQDISFAVNIPDLTINEFDPTTGSIDPTTGARSAQAAPEPGTWALIATGMLGLGGLKRRWRGRA
jgi:hypothetical protein